ncbi:MAG: hypothetical protein AAF907_02550, partial [Planctomycetota bacterium]
GAASLNGFRDGTTQTFLGGQVAGFFKPWADPENLRDGAHGIGSGPRQFGTRSRITDHGVVIDGAVMLLADGSTMFFSAEMDPAAFAAMGTPAGAEALKEWDISGQSREQWER